VTRARHGGGRRRGGSSRNRPPPPFHDGSGSDEADPSSPGPAPPPTTPTSRPDAVPVGRAPDPPPAVNPAVARYLLAVVVGMRSTAARKDLLMGSMRAEGAKVSPRWEREKAVTPRAVCRRGWETLRSTRSMPSPRVTCAPRTSAARRDLVRVGPGRHDPWRVNRPRRGSIGDAPADPASGTTGAVFLTSRRPEAEPRQGFPFFLLFGFLGSTVAVLLVWALLPSMVSRRVGRAYPKAAVVPHQEGPLVVVAGAGEAAGLAIHSLQAVIELSFTKFQKTSKLRQCIFRIYINITLFLLKTLEEIMHDLFEGLNGFLRAANGVTFPVLLAAFCLGLFLLMIWQADKVRKYRADSESKLKERHTESEKERIDLLKTMISANSKQQEEILKRLDGQ
jgi:hypothetical protein